MQPTTFEEKRRKFLPQPRRAVGKPTIYLEGYPTEDGEPMSATEFHGRQISILSNQLNDYFGDDTLAYVGTDSFVYYQQGDPRKVVAPDIHVVLGVPPTPVRRSFYTWAEGVIPAVVFEFLSDSTANEDRGNKRRRYFSEIGIHEYFIHQPAGDRPPEFRGWRRTTSGHEEILPDERGALFSEALNLWFLVEDQPNEVRLMRPYLPDGTPLPTSAELKAEKEELKVERDEAKAQAEAAETLAESYGRRIAELEAEMARLRETLEQKSRS